MLDLLNALYQEGRFMPHKTLQQCQALADAAYVLGSHSMSAHMIRAAIESLRAAFENSPSGAINPPSNDFPGNYSGISQAA